MTNQTPNNKIEKALPVTANNDQLQANTINARDLHSYLESKQDFSTWIKKRIQKYQFIEGEDFVLFHKKMENSKMGRPSVEYHITTDMAKELGMVENNTRGREIRNYFIQVEKNARAFNDALQDTPAIVLERYAKVKREQEQLAATLKEAQPKLETFDLMFSDDQSECTLSEFAKTLNQKGDLELSRQFGGGRRLKDYLKTTGVLIPSSGLPYQRYIEAGYFKTYVYKHNGGKVTRSKLTKKGCVWLTRKLMNSTTKTH